MAADADTSYDRLAEMKAFDETKLGVKGLVDSGIKDIPRIFHAPPSFLDGIGGGDGDNNKSNNFKFPIVDLEEKRSILVEKVREASKDWGFFLVVNHGVGLQVMEEMLAATRRFHEHDVEGKKKLFNREANRGIYYNSNHDLYVAPLVNWRDSLLIDMAPHPPDSSHLPTDLRDVVGEYSKEMLKLGELLAELLSESLGLNPHYLKQIDCVKGLTMACHYYPPCPQPELALGLTKHTDFDFLTVVLQDHIGGLQVLYRNQYWVDVPYFPGSLVINIGDLLQLISNDNFTSVEHRVVANNIGPRVSVVSFFSTAYFPNQRLYGPIKELLSQDNPPKYRETTIPEFHEFAYKKGHDGKSPLFNYRL
ncbi:1-aminocyclopropane-1-carboxylate oxidase homolog 1 [Linum perenne]